MRARTASRWTCAVFVVSVGTFFWLLNSAAHKYLKPKIDDRSLTITNGLPSSYFIPEISDPAAAKAQHRFFVSRADFRGVGLALRENAELFAEAFPGYESLRQDEDFWRDYFKLEFEFGGLWVPRLNHNLPERLVAYSWQACPKIFAREGADILLLGSSQVFRGIIPSLLHSKSGHSEKILMCAKPHMTSPPVAYVAKSLQKSGKKTEWAVWGYSPWNVGADGEKNGDLDEFKKLIDGPGFWDRRLSNWFPSISWNQFVQFSYDNLMAHLSPTQSFDYAERPGDLGPDETISPQHGDFWFSRTEASDPVAVERLVRNSQRPDLAMSMDRKHCHFDVASAELDSAIRELLQVSHRVFIYLAPTVNFFENSPDACTLPALQALLRSKAGPRVLVETGDRDSYGLKYTDFVYQYARRGLVNLDPVHVNFVGAQKLTTRLSQILVAAQEPTSPKDEGNVLP